MQASAVITVAARSLNDVARVRWPVTPTDILLGYVKDLQQAFLRHRKDVLLGSGETMSAETAIASTTTVLAIPDAYLEHAANYVVGRALSEDNSDTSQIELGNSLIKRALLAFTTGQV